MKYIITSNEDSVDQVTVLHNGELHATNSDNPNYTDIVMQLLNGVADQSTVDLFLPEDFVKKAFAALSADVVIDDGLVWYRDEPLSDVLSDYIVKAWQNKEELGPVVKFVEKLYQNPNPHSVDQLWTWLKAYDFTLTSDGDILGYKGVRDDLRSLNLGENDIVDGKPVSKIYNNVGSVVEKDRNSVQFDPAIGCSFGLHVGTYQYASGFGSTVVGVKVNPADVVSVPTECNGEKMRVCRYTVTEIVDSKYDGYVKYYGEYDAHEDDLDDNYDGLVDRSFSRVDTRLNHVKQRRDANGRFTK